MIRSRRALLPVLAAALLTGCTTQTAGVGTPGGTAAPVTTLPADPVTAATKTPATSTTTTATTPPPTTPPGPDLSRLSAAAILAKAKQAVLDAGSMRVQGTMSGDGGDLSYDIRMSPGRATGTYSSPSGGFTAVVVNRVGYVKPDNTFWTSYLGVSQKTLRTVSGKWVRPAPDDDAWTGLMQLFNFTDFVAEDLTADGSVAKGRTKALNGQPVQGLLVGGSDPFTVWVSAVGAPYPLMTEGDAASRGAVIFGEFGQPVSATAPAAGQIVVQPSG